MAFVLCGPCVTSPYSIFIPCKFDDVIIFLVHRRGQVHECDGGEVLSAHKNVDRDIDDIGTSLHPTFYGVSQFEFWILSPLRNSFLDFLHLIVSLKDLS